MYMEVEVSIIVPVKSPEQLLHKSLGILQRHHTAVQGHNLLPAHLAGGTLGLENTEAKFSYNRFSKCDCLSVHI